MNPFAQAWVKALRSGKYQQALGALHQQTPEGDRYCCLGIACKLFGEENPGLLNIGESLTRPTIGVRNITYDDDVAGLPFLVRDALGLTHIFGRYRLENGDSRSVNGFSTLALQNDSGATSDEIADIIEAEPMGLFV